MTAEQREIPFGYVPKLLPNIHAEVLLPAEWTYRERETEISYMFEASPDNLSGVAALLPNKTTLLVNADDANKTIFGVNVHHNFSEQNKANASAWAENYMAHPKFMSPRGPLQLTRDSNNEHMLTIRRLFISTATTVGGVAYQPKMSYVEITVNEKTDRFYMINFETEVKNWREYEDRAKILVERVKLDPTF